MYYRDEMGLRTSVGDAVIYSEKEVNRLIKGRYDMDKKSTSLSPIEQVIQSQTEHLSDEQIVLLNRIDELLNDAPNDFDTTIDNLEEIQLIARRDLDKEDAQVILAGAEIGKASLHYWKNNIGAWEQALSTGGVQEKDWFDWSEVAGADVAGGVGGAVTAAVVNAVPGAGQVAYGGAILGGAAGGSATDAVLQVWNNYF